MKTPKSFMLVAVAAALLILAGCSDDDNPMQPGTAGFTGTWSGSLVHPSYSGGTLTLNLTEVRADSITGTFQLRLSRILPNGRTEVQNYGGNVTDAGRTGETGISFTLQHTQFTWDATGSSPATGRLNGTWVARGVTGINGTFDIARN